MINKLRLKNIKSYKDETIIFADGLNAIIGINGAGKSTIVEALGYMLFDSMPYNVDAFIRYGSKSGEIWLYLEEGIVLYRKLGKSVKFNVYGPNNDMIAEGKKEYFNAVKNILGHTDKDLRILKALWEQVVGVPQGMFTAMFLETPENRKVLFNSLLMIDKYKRYYNDMAGVVKKVETEINNIKSQIDKLSYADEETEKAKEELDKYTELDVIATDNYKTVLEDYNEQMSIFENEDSKRKEVESLEHKVNVLTNKLNMLQDWKDFDFQMQKENYEALLSKGTKINSLNSEINKMGEIDDVEDKLNIINTKLKSIDTKIITFQAKIKMLKVDIGTEGELKNKLKSLPTNIEHGIKSLEIKLKNLVTKGQNLKNKLTIADRYLEPGDSKCPIFETECPLFKDCDSDICINLEEVNAELQHTSKDIVIIHEKKMALSDDQTDKNSLEDKLVCIEGNKEELKMKLAQVSKMNELRDGIVEDLAKGEKDMEKVRQKQKLEAVIVGLETAVSRGKDKQVEWDRMAKQKGDYENSRTEINNLRESIEQSGFSHDVWQKLRTKTTELKNEMANLSANKMGYGQLIMKFNNNIKRLESIIKEREQFEKDMDKMGGFNIFVDKIRDAVKLVPAKIFDRLRGTITIMANETFMDLMGDRSTVLELTEDYNINVMGSEGQRTFKQLSGGEQMIAAISVRLAISKLLSGLSFVILDEPTQNLDDVRCDMLANNIVKIKGFEQILVITHDSSFEGYVNHIVKVRKESGISMANC